MCFFYAFERFTLEVISFVIGFFQFVNSDLSSSGKTITSILLIAFGINALSGVGFNLYSDIIQKCKSFLPLTKWH